jgi:hypothetical protein
MAPALLHYGQWRGAVASGVEFDEVFGTSAARSLEGTAHILVQTQKPTPTPTALLLSGHQFSSTKSPIPHIFLPRLGTREGGEALSIDHVG